MQGSQLSGDTANVVTDRPEGKVYRVTAVVEQDVVGPAALVACPADVLVAIPAAHGVMLVDRAGFSGFDELLGEATDIVESSCVGDENLLAEFPSLSC